MALVFIFADYSGCLVALEKLQGLQPHDTLLQLLDLHTQVVESDAIAEVV